jgi:hypothetical protein
LRGEGTIVVATKMQNTIVSKRPENLNAQTVKEADNSLFTSMFVDSRLQRNTDQREMIREFLKVEFGNKYQFSESFISSVLEKLQ